MSPKANKKQDELEMAMSPIDSISLASLGAYMIFTEIDAPAAEKFCEFLIKANYIFPKDQVLTVLVNSGGGSVYDGFGMIDLMECGRLKIQTVGIGIIASMASLIFTAGSKGMRTMSRNAYMMTHQFSNGTEGKYHELIATREHEDELHQRFVQHYMRHSKMSEKQVKDVLINASDKYIGAKDCLKYGLCDVIKDPWA